MSGLGINNLESIKFPVQTYTDTDGEEHEIDLKVRTSDTAEYKFENRSNTIQTFFKSNLCGYSPVKVETGDAFFEWTPLGAGFQDELGNEQWMGRVENCEAQVVRENTVLYKNVMGDIDEEFQVLSGKLKHNTVLNSLPVYDQSLPGSDIRFVVEGKIDFSENVFVFSEGYTLVDKLETSEEVQFIDTEGATTFTLPSPVAYEISGSESDVCKYTVTKIERNLYSLKISLSYAWLRDKNRNYPVAIDPTLVGIDNPPGMSGRVKRLAFSNNSKYLAIATLNENKPYVYEINRDTHTLKELPKPTGGYERGDQCVLFSSDDNYLLIGGTYKLTVYRFDTLTGGYTTIIPQPNVSTFDGTVRDIAFSEDFSYLAVSHNYTIRTYKFDSASGILSKQNVLNTPYYPLKMGFSKNNKFLLTKQSDYTLRTYNFNDGILSNVTAAFNGQFYDFDFSADFDYLAVGLNVAPWFSVYKFDSDLGMSGPPINPKVQPNLTVRKIHFSRKTQNIVIAQYNQWSTYQRILIYRFDKKTGEIGQQVTLDNTTKLPPTNLNTEPLDLVFSPDGVYLGYTQDSDAANSLFLYRFFYEPENNIFFKDEKTSDYYSDNNGNTLMLLDFGQIVAGQTSLPVKVLVENLNDFPVKNLQIELINPSTDYTVEISKSDNPFIPETNLLYSNPLNNLDRVPIYFRIVTTEKSTSGGMFEVRAKCSKI
ncbi:WD40 repeat domain-containing protein [Paenibacillus chitinolyticus]|uniref:WD40 repeat domain-containing protein n=1 Tax=Paenibacillus chitinolyticus TaxID=79263 RepID=UPI00362ABD4E